MAVWHTGLIRVVISLPGRRRKCRGENPEYEPDSLAGEFFNLSIDRVAMVTTFKSLVEI